MILIVCCSCVEQKYENVYYILIFNILIQGHRGRNVRATAIFITFFILFTSASIAVPIPLFPGNTIPTLLEIPTSESTSYLGALTNGLTYGFITWIIFYLIDKRMEKAFINGY
jgi:hypothetical protein